MRERGSSLLAVGVRGVRATLSAVRPCGCSRPAASELARGLTRYRSSDVRRIAGLRSSAIEAALGFNDGPEVVHRDDLVLL